MTRDQFREFALETMGTLDELDGVADTMKHGINLLRVQITDAVQAVDNHRDACIGDCARELREKILLGNRAILQATDNWLSASHR
jgi:hypothetical protein